jgi:hypothetical protein
VREKHAVNHRTLCRLFVDIEDHSDYIQKCARVVLFVAFCKADGGGNDPMDRLLFASDASGNDDEDADEDMPRQKRRRRKDEEEEVESQDQGNSADLGDGEDAEEAEDVDVEEAEEEEAVGGGDSGDASDDGAPSASSKARSERTTPAGIRRKWPAHTLKAETVNKKSLPRKSATDAENPGKGISGKCGMCLKTSAKVRSLTSHLSFHCNAGILPYILTLRVNVYYGRVATGQFTAERSANCTHRAVARYILGQFVVCLG